MNGKLRLPTTVVAHDAGAANLIAAWIKDLPRENFYVFMEGPARAIWATHSDIPPMPLSDLRSALSVSRQLLSGTGWGEVEHSARLIASELRVDSIAVVDHWVNYRSRFVRDGQEILPREMWVADEYAENMAIAEFPGTKIVRMPNRYLEFQTKRIRALSRRYQRLQGTRILYLLEPLRERRSGDARLGELIALQYFLWNLGLLGIQDPPQIILRPHPSEPASKYRNIEVSLLPPTRWKIDAELPLADQLAWANVVVGCHTYGLAVALASGKRTICSLPPDFSPCAIPLPGLEHLKLLVRNNSLGDPE